MSRMCEDCNREPIAVFNKSGFCSKCRCRNYVKTEKSRKYKLEQYYKLRNAEGKMLTDCGHQMCEAQKRRVRAHPSEMYNLYNKCKKCDVLWEKHIMRCPHCNRPLRLNPKNRRPNKKLYTNTMEKSY